ncbi:hypothetical protein DPMN_151177 [Dreissena polymorpha]|uniref:Uncharacterized protein n=1 Tax=Dreissena polymorpha TaxID=45954 RepID=A0A9D4FHW6_DREPO|nr:hypothetical protein DPMN_151177 [Dreissena polymorpha]
MPAKRKRIVNVGLPITKLSLWAPPTTDETTAETKRIKLEVQIKIAISLTCRSTCISITHRNCR